jgi:hypothetical protein
VVFIEESSKRRVNAYIPKYISMAYCIMFLWIPERDRQITGNFLVNALHAFHRLNRRYHVKKFNTFKCFMHRWEDFSYNYLFLLSIFQPSSHSMLCLLSLGLSSLIRYFQHPTRPVENLALTTKGLQERKHNIEWNDGGKIGNKNK